MCTAPARNAGLARIRRWREQRGLHPFDPVARQRVRQPVQGLVAVPPAGDDLRQERVVVDGDHAARLHAALVAEPGPLRQLERGDGPRGRQEVPVRVLRVDAALDRRAPRRDDPSWPHAEPLPGRDPQLGLDEVQPHDLLGHRVLHLEPGVHLEEVEAVPSTRNSTVPAFR